MRKVVVPPPQTIAFHGRRPGQVFSTSFVGEGEFDQRAFAPVAIDVGDGGADPVRGGRALKPPHSRTVECRVVEVRIVDEAMFEIGPRDRRMLLYTVFTFPTSFITFIYAQRRVAYGCLAFGLADAAFASPPPELGFDRMSSSVWRTDRPLRTT